MVGRYLTIYLIGREAILKRINPFPPVPCGTVGLCGISSRFQLLSPTPGQVPHVLLTRSPLSYPCVHPKTSAEITPFDLHVLGAPPAFVLSQDQTLYKMVSKPDHSEFKSLHSQTQSLASCELLFGIFKVFSTLKKGPSSSSYCSIFKVLLPPLSRGSLLIISLVRLFVKSFLKVFSQAFHSVSLVICGSVIIPHQGAKSQRGNAGFLAKSLSFGSLPICLSPFCEFSRLFAATVYTACTKGKKRPCAALLSVLNAETTGKAKGGLWPPPCKIFLTFFGYPWSRSSRISFNILRSRREICTWVVPSTRAVSLWVLPEKKRR